MKPGDVVWEPPADARTNSNLGRFMSMVNETRDYDIGDYEALWQWSISDVGAFWESLATFFDVQFTAVATSPLTQKDIAHAQWFPGARLNFAEHALRGSGPEALVGISQTRSRTTLSWDELRSAVARCRRGLLDQGLTVGDRVAAYLPNIEEAAIAYLATISLGAVWSSCSPEFGVRGAVDRFRQIEPTVLLAVDGYRYGAKTIDRNEDVRRIREALPSLQAAVMVPYLFPERVDSDWLSWDALVCNESEELAFEPVPFDHPMVILFSSGTTGLPKPIVHGHGGLLLEHLKLHGLQHDLGEADRFSWLTTTGWVMWNILVSGLLVNATTVLWDGNFTFPDLAAPWEFCASEKLTEFGVSAGYVLAARKAGLRPRELVDLRQLRLLGSTGSPLPVEGYEWVYGDVKSDLALVSMSGGTDIASAFVGGSPLVPVYAGEMSCRCLGVDAVACDERGVVVEEQEGELVIRRPLPSMPVSFWGDADGRRLHDAYFKAFAGVWHHGDWILFRHRGSSIISGRSDSTLNRGGVRLGTAEFYGLVEDLPEISDSLVVNLDSGPDGASKLLLFVVLAGGHGLDDSLRSKISTALRNDLSARHVPDEVIAVPAIPRTSTGKKMEVPVKRVLQGALPADVSGAASLEDASALEEFVQFAHRLESA